MFVCFVNQSSVILTLNEATHFIIGISYSFISQKTKSHSSISSKNEVSKVTKNLTLFINTTLGKIQILWQRLLYDAEKDLEAWGLYYKTFYGRNVQIFVIS
jgi:hypothetical protein